MTLFSYTPHAYRRHDVLLTSIRAGIILYYILILIIFIYLFFTQARVSLALVNFLPRRTSIARSGRTAPMPTIQTHVLGLNDDPIFVVACKAVNISNDNKVSGDRFKTYTQFK